MMKKMVYLSALTSLIGASVISIDLNLFQLSIFRAIIISLIFGVMIKVSLRDYKIKLFNSGPSSYSIKFMLFWLIYAFFSIAWVQDYGAWFKAVYFLFLGVLCIVMFSQILKTTNDVLNAFRAMIIMIVIHNFIGWYEILTGNYLFLSSERVGKYAYFNYPSSMFSNSNDYATLMLFSVFIAYFCAVNSKRFIGIAIYVSTMISSILLVIMANSRANSLGLILAFIIFVYFSMRNKRGRQTVLIFLILLFGTIMIIPETFTNILIDINQKLDFSSNIGSDLIRINLIKNGFLFLINTFGFGTGAGNIEYWMKNSSEYFTWGIVNIHNWWMEILSGYGLVIFILYVVFYLKLFIDLKRIYVTSKGKKEQSISLGIMCCMGGFIVGSISSSSNLSSEWLWVFWSIAIALQGIIKKDHFSKLEQKN